MLKSAIGFSKEGGEQYSKFVLTTFNRCDGMIHLCKKLGLKEVRRERLLKPYGGNRYAVYFECDLRNYEFPSLKKRLLVPEITQNYAVEQGSCTYIKRE